MILIGGGWVRVRIKEGNKIIKKEAKTGEVRGDRIICHASNRV